MRNFVYGLLFALFVIVLVRGLSRDLPPERSLPVQDGSIEAFSADDTLFVAAGREEIALWDPLSAEKIAAIQPPASDVIDTSFQVRKIAFSPKGDALAVLMSEVVKIFSVPDLSLTREISGWHGILAWSQDGTMIATGGEYQEIVIRRVEDGSEVRRIVPKRNVQAVAFLVGDREIVSGGFDPLRIWDIASGKIVHEFPKKEDSEIRCIAASPTERAFATGDDKGEVRTYAFLKENYKEEWKDLCGNQRIGHVFAVDYLSIGTDVQVVSVSRKEFCIFPLLTPNPSAGKWPLQGLEVAALSPSANFVAIRQRSPSASLYTSPRRIR